MESVFPTPRMWDGLVTFFGRDSAAKVTLGSEPGVLGDSMKAAGQFLEIKGQGLPPFG